MKFAVVGDPVNHSLSPAMHQAAFQVLGLDHTYEAVQVRAAEFHDAVERLATDGYEGLNVTVPLKETAAQWCKPDRFVAECGSANTLRLASREGINTDAPATLKVLLDTGLRGTFPNRALILGAGGTARALALALHRSGYQVDIWNRTAATAHALATQIGCKAEEDPNIADYHVVLNATKASMDGMLPQVVKDQIPFLNRNASIAMDLYYSPQGTIFQRAFNDAGWKTVDGREVLVAQGALAFEFWLCIPAPLEAMRAAVGL